MIAKLSPISDEAVIKSAFAIPAGWMEAASFIAELRNRPPLTDSEWDVLNSWMNSTQFDDRSYLAAEVAAGLVRDLAPFHVKQRLLAESPVDKWHQIIQAIVRIGPNRIHELGGVATTPVPE